MPPALVCFRKGPRCAKQTHGYSRALLGLSQSGTSFIQVTGLSLNSLGSGFFLAFCPFWVAPSNLRLGEGPQLSWGRRLEVALGHPTWVQRLQFPSPELTLATLGHVRTFSCQWGPPASAMPDRGPTHFCAPLAPAKADFEGVSTPQPAVFCTPTFMREAGSCSCCPQCWRGMGTSLLGFLLHLSASRVCGMRPVRLSICKQS